MEFISLKMKEDKLWDSWALLVLHAQLWRSSFLQPLLRVISSVMQTVLGVVKTALPGNFRTVQNVRRCWGWLVILCYQDEKTEGQRRKNTWSSLFWEGQTLHQASITELCCSLALFLRVGPSLVLSGRRLSLCLTTKYAFETCPAPMSGCPLGWVSTSWRLGCSPIMFFPIS